MTLEGVIQTTREPAQQTIHVRHRPFAVPPDGILGSQPPATVLTYDSALALAQANGERLLDPRDVLRLYDTAETKPIGAFQLLAHERPAFFVRGAYWWEGDGLYISLGDASESLYFDPKSNQHAWHDGAPQATRYELPSRVLKQAIQWSPAVFDEYGRAIANTAVQSIVISPRARYPLRRFFATNRALSWELFGQTYSQLPEEIQQGSIELPARSGVPVPFTYDANRRLFACILWTSTLVTKRPA